MLRSSGTLLLGGAVGAGMISRIASDASAADADLAVAGDHAEIREGEVTGVPLDIEVSWSYAVPSGERPDTLVVDVLAGTSEAELEPVASSEQSQAFLESSGEETFAVDLLGEGIVGSDAMTPAEKGAETATEMVVGVELRLYDDSELVIAADSAVDTALVTVAKDDYDPAAHGDVSGEGSVTVEID